MMKDGMLFGLAVGMIAGALLFKHCQPCKELVNQGEKAIKKEIRDMTETKKKTTSK